MKKRYFLNILIFLAFLFGPIMLALLVNVGLIYDIPNIFPALNNIVKHLSNIRESVWIINLFLINVTIFVIFFGLAPLSYSMNYIPSQIIRKYIYKNKYSYHYFALEFSFGSVLAFFSYNDNIHNLNIILCISFVVFSISSSVIYFYWLTKIINAENIFALILKRINFDSLNKIENKLSENRNSFQKYLSSFQNLFLTGEDGEYAFLIANPYNIFDTANGLVKSINIEQIHSLLKEIEEKIENIAIHVNIGDSLPRPQYRKIPNQIPDTLLLTVNIKADIINKELETLQEYIQKKEFELKNCFEIDESENLFYEFSNILDDLLLLYSQVSLSNQITSKFLLRHLESFIRNEYFKSQGSNWETEVSIKKDIFIYITDKFTELAKGNLTDLQFQDIMLFIYNIRHLAIKNNSITLMKSVLKLMGLLFFNAIIREKVYNPKIPIFLLNLKEVCLPYELSERVDNESSDDFKNSIVNFYDPIINQGIETAINTFYFLIKFFYVRHPTEAIYYLESNAQYLLELISRINYWKNNHNEWKNSKFKLLAKYILYLSILIYKRFERGELPPELVSKISFQLATYCDTRSIRLINRSSDGYLDEFIFDHNFNYPTDSLIMQWFESSIHEAGTYTPSFYDFSFFWITYSVYRNHYGKPFIPTQSLNQSDFELQVKNLIERMAGIDVEKISKIIKIDKNEINKILDSYKIYLKNFLQKNGNH